MEKTDYNMDLDNVLHDVDKEVLDLYSDERADVPARNVQDKSGQPIAKDMMIEEIVTDHPDIVPMLMDYGVHCVGCGGASFETLEEGFMGHGMDAGEVDRIVEELNEYIKKNNV